MGLRGGRYETLRRIASGGMARVYLARALGAGGFERLVALKALHDHLAEEQDFIDMFLDEARLAARIRHPNVVGTLDVQHDDEGVFLVMEYVEGPTVAKALRELRRQKRALPLDVALRIFLDTLAGLHAAHELTDANGDPVHVVHRDVSPQNILLGVDGVARLTDFGVASATARLSTTRDGDVKGKGPYMAPEQVNAEPVDRRTDLYAAGAVLWELLVGECLVQGDNDGAVVMGVLAKEKRSPRTVVPSVPEPLCAACLRALAFRPEDRFATAAELIEAVESAARAAGVIPAKPRVVAAFVRELNAHEAPVDLPSTGVVPIEHKSQASRVIPVSPADREAFSSQPSIEAPRADEGAAGPPAHASQSSMPSPALVASAAPPGPARGRAAVFSGVALAALVGVVAVVVFLLRSGAPPSTPAASPAASSSFAPSSAAAAPSASSSAPSSDPSAVPSTEPSASAAPSASAPVRKPGKMPRIVGPNYRPSGI